MGAMTKTLDAVAAATKVFLKAEAAAAKARSELHAAIVAATDAGDRQVDITDRSPYKREQVRRIVDNARKRRTPAES